MKRTCLIGVAACAALVAAAPAKANPEHGAKPHAITRDFLKTVCAKMKRIKMQTGDPVIVLCLAPEVDDHPEEITRIRCGGPVVDDAPDSRYIMVIDSKCRL